MRERRPRSARPADRRWWGITLTTLLLTVGICGVLAGPSHAASASAWSESTTFGDTFSNNRIDGWRRVDDGRRDGPSNWRASSRRLRDTSGIQGGSRTPNAIAKPGTVLHAGNTAWRDYEFSVSASSPDDDALGVVFRYQDRDNYYRFSMDRQRHYRRLVKKVDGRFSLVAESRVGYRSGDWYRIRVVTAGSRLRVSMNGRQVFDVVDTSLDHGHVGVYTWGSSRSVFDNVAVETVGPAPFTIAVVPDTQYSSARYPEMLEAQMRWLARNRGPLGLAAVVQLGDIVNTMTADQQWANARRGYGYLEGKVPFVAAAGNHDEQHQGTDERPYEKDPEQYNRFIGSFRDYRVDGFYRAGDHRNTFRYLTAGDVRLLVLNLEFGAPDPVLAWAGQVAAAHPARHVLVVTHDYLGTDNQWRGAADRTDSTLPHNHNPVLNDGVDIWEKFVRHHQNVQFVLNGHVIQQVGPDEPWAAGRLVSRNDAGGTVYQMLSNYQTYSPGGRGFLRLLRFQPLAGRVDVSTYSPYTKGHLTDGRNQFSLEGVDLGSWPG